MRHGQAESNVGHWHCSWPEKRIAQLTPRGKKQAEKSAQFFKKIGLDLILTSDLTRTRQTAEIISKATKVPIIFDKGLRELDFGIFNYQKLDGYWKYFKNQSLIRFYKCPPKGETLLEAQKRIVSFFQKTNKKYKNKKVLIISHMGPLWLLEAWLKKYPPQKAIRMSRSMLQFAQYKKLKT